MYVIEGHDVWFLLRLFREVLLPLYGHFRAAGCGVVGFQCFAEKWYIFGVRYDAVVLQNWWRDTNLKKNLVVFLPADVKENKENKQMNLWAWQLTCDVLSWSYLSFKQYKKYTTVKWAITLSPRSNIWNWTVASCSACVPGISLNLIAISILGCADWTFFLSPPCLAVGSTHQQGYF